MKIEFVFPKGNNIKGSILPFLSGFLLLLLLSLTIYVFKEIYIGNYSYFVNTIFNILNNPFAFFLEVVSLPKILWGTWKKVPPVIHLAVLLYSLYGIIKVAPLAILKIKGQDYCPSETPDET